MRFLPDPDGPIETVLSCRPIGWSVLTEFLDPEGEADFFVRKIAPADEFELVPPVRANCGIFCAVVILGVVFWCAVAWLVL